MFKQNENKLDKNIRLVVGVIALFVGIFVFSGIIQTITLIIAALAIFTGLTGFCLLYKLFGINTNK